MKKVLALILALVMAISFASCGGNTSSDPEEVVISAAKAAVQAEVMLNYKTQGPATVTTFVTKNSETEYTVTGKATVTDDYGDEYTGKYTVEVEYDPETNKADSKDCDLETPTKD